MSEGLHARLRVTYAQFHLDVELRLPGRGITALFGPSGSGKTTCLRTIAGLERASNGYVSLDGEVWQDAEHGIFLPTHRRALAYVFQEASLFVHLSVRGNLEYGLKRAGALDSGEWDRTVELLGIAHLLARRPDRLSGGERQRVAIARALLTRPRLLLLDEPLAAIDSARKDEILPFLERLHNEVKIPSLYVTHSLDEVCRLADHLVILDRGVVIASGPMQETLARTDLPATFLERVGVVIEAIVCDYDESDQLLQLQFAGGILFVPARGQRVGSTVRCRIEARDVSLTVDRQTGTSILNVVPVTIETVTDASHPSQLLVRLDANGTSLLAQVTRRSWNVLGLSTASRAWAQIKAVVLIG